MRLFDNHKDDLTQLRDLYKKHEKQINQERQKELLKIYNNILAKIKEEIYLNPITEYKYTLPQTKISLDMIVNKLTDEGFKIRLEDGINPAGIKDIIISGWDK
jgi:hypothetical protein